jgi:signal transduction histidine kinase
MKGLNFQSEIDSHLPDQILADPYWLKQILLNLVNNASKITEKGFIKVWFFLSDETHWAIQVSGSGIGIPSDARGSIFEPFRQVNGEKMHAGSGLGLAIVNQLTALMNGRIELQSEIRSGSVFTIILPMKIP